MRFRTLHFGFQSTLALAGLALGLAAGCNQNGDSSGSGSCIPGQVDFCPCAGDLPTTPTGLQTCQPDGTYGLCECGAPMATEGNSDGSSTGDTAESESDSQSTTGSGPDLCGNGFPDPGECDIGPDGDMVPCPQDCPTDSDTDTEGDSESDTDGTTGVVDVCEGVPIYVGMVADSPSVWEFPGFGQGFTSGTQACIAGGYEGVCTYSQLVEASDQGDFAAVPPGTTYWVHRVVATEYMGMMIQPDTRSRCDDWRYPTNDVNDGEYATVAAGALTFTLDADPNPNMADAFGLDCGGVIRSIPCCNVCEG